MILYVNGDNHTIAAQATNSYISASEDRMYGHLKDLGHPNNIEISWGMLLAKSLKAAFQLDAKADYSRNDIITSTRNWLVEAENITKLSNVFIVIQWPTTTIDDYQSIIDLHEQLRANNLRHIFFNSTSFFKVYSQDKYSFGINYIDPYLSEGSYDGWLQAQGYSTVVTSNFYYGAEAHAAWAKRLLQHIVLNKMV